MPRRRRTRDETTVVVVCPYSSPRIRRTPRCGLENCFEEVDLYVDPGTEGEMVEDCAVCCRPWAVWISRELGELQATVGRAQ